MLLLLLVPVVGPFLAMDPAQSGSAGVALALVGGVQVISLAIGTGGIVRYARSKRRVQAGYESMPGGGGMVKIGFQF